MLKLLVLQQWYGLSDPELERALWEEVQRTKVRLAEVPN
jgi:IS5 family transposase